ncbi:UPF0280 family protein [soil metagenome]
MSAQRQLLAGDRWHFQHGPIDVVIGADGEPGAVRAAHAAAWLRFENLLSELVGELGWLRSPIDATDVDCPVHGSIARRMWNACRPFSHGFITPMAAVAGSVAQELIACYGRPGVSRAWVNNGGDIALHLSKGTSVKVGLYADLANFDRHAAAQAMDPLAHGALSMDGMFEVHASMPIRGIATSGWRGRSHSLGIADSVTVFARTAAEADAAATIVANAVDVSHPSIVRVPATDVREDSDLGSLCVTVEVPSLAPMLVARALDAGKRVAEQLRADDMLWGVVLTCQGQAVVVGSVLA